jgi:hypothetical protein
MKNKLITTALVSSILGLGVSSAVAQTTITGNLELSYHATSHEGNATAAQKQLNTRGFGKESQINIANKGKLSNGMDYAAGFSIEMDGIDGTSDNPTVTGGFNENVYIDIISGNTTLTVGADHIQNPDRNITNLVGFGYLGIDGINNLISSYSKSIGSPYSSFGVGIVQNVGIGRVSALYTPGGAAANDVLNGLQTNQTDAGESMYELGFKGDLGVKGLDVGIFYNKADKAGQIAANTDPKGQKIELSYNMGQFTVAGEYAKQDGIATQTGTTSAYTAGANEHKMKSIGVAYAVDKALSIGYTYGVADSNSVTANQTADEKINLFAIGYNLGPVTAQLQYKSVENAANFNGLDGEQVSARLATKF